MGRDRKAPTLSPAVGCVGSNRLEGYSIQTTAHYSERLTHILYLAWLFQLPSSNAGEQLLSQLCPYTVGVTIL
jgi:hypothetical protein